MDHYVLTRFNVDHRELARLTTHKGLDLGWLEHRLPMFERICAPSMRAQTSRPHRWLVYVHPDTPEPYRSRILAAVESADGEVVWSETGSVEEVRTTVAGTGQLVTTRLDCDDALARDFLTHVRDAAERADTPRLLNFPDGAQLHTWRGVAVEVRSESNPFLSYVEPNSADPLTVWGLGSHVHVGETPVEQVEGLAPAWLQAIHSHNVANPRHLGRAIPKSRVLEVIGVEPDQLAGTVAELRYRVEGPVRPLWHRMRDRLRA